MSNKIVDLKEIIQELLLDYFILSEIKIEQNFPTRQFYIKGYKIRARRGRDKHDGGLIELVKDGFIPKNRKEYGTKQGDSIRSEFTISYKQEINMLRYL